MSQDEPSRLSDALFVSQSLLSTQSFWGLRFALNAEASMLRHDRKNEDRRDEKKDGSDRDRKRKHEVRHWSAVLCFLSFASSDSHAISSMCGLLRNMLGSSGLLRI